MEKERTQPLHIPFSLMNEIKFLKAEHDLKNKVSTSLQDFGVKVLRAGLESLNGGQQDAKERE
jgi:hypothetical protein